MAKKEKLFSKVVMLVFLVLIVLGFTVPGFIDSEEPTQRVNTNERLCQTDADCYLICDDTPLKVLCSENLCQQNNCEENGYYQFIDEAINFELSIKVDNKEIDLTERAVEGNMFVNFENNNVKIFSEGTSLVQVLEKVNIDLSQCLVIDEESYCDEGLKVFVNNEQSYKFTTYVPQEGDLINIVYS